MSNGWVKLKFDCHHYNFMLKLGHRHHNKQYFEGIKELTVLKYARTILNLNYWIASHIIDSS